VDITAQHDADDAQGRLDAAAAAAEIPEHEHTVDGEQIELSEEQRRTLDECQARQIAALERLEELSTPEAVFGVPEDVNRSALNNALAQIIVDAGLVTLADLAVKKELALSDLLEEIVQNATEHAAQMAMARSMADIAQPADALQKIPPMPPRKQAAARRRRRGR
jgi:hypothetical protein